MQVVYSADRLADVCRRIGWRGRIQLEPLFGHRDESMGRLVLGAWGQLQARRPLSRATAELAVQLVLAMLLQTYAADRGGVAPPVMSGAVRATIGRIETQLDGDLRLSALAAAAGVSPSSLAKSFRATIGASLHQYVLRRRIERAQALLRTTRMPVTEIAGLTGFGNSQHFSTAFRRAVGSTPSQYRRRQG